MLFDPDLTYDENAKVFGKCLNLHGHTYHLFVTVSGEEKSGMIINFVELKEIVNANVIDKFDHQYLNHTQEMKNVISTCENQITIIWDLLEEKLKAKNITLEELKLYETETSFATLTK